MGKIFLAGLAVAALTSAASQATVLYQTSFEAPAFGVGVLAGQDGWQQSSNPANLFRIGSGALARSGSQYAAADTATAAGNGLQWSFRPQVIMPVTPPSVIRASVYVSVQNNQTPTSTRVSGAGLDLFAENGTFRIGSIAIRNDGMITLTNGFAQTSTVGPGAVDASVFHQIAIEADFASHALRFYVDGLLLNSPSAFNKFNTGVTGFGNASLQAARASTVSGSGSGGHTVVFDDYLLEQIPGPGGLALAVVAGVCAARRRR